MGFEDGPRRVAIQARPGLRQHIRMKRPPLNVRFTTYPHQFSFIWSGPWLKAHCLLEKLNVAHATSIFKHSKDALPSASPVQRLETQIQIFRFFKIHLTHPAVHARLPIPTSNFPLSDPFKPSLELIEHCSHSSPLSRSHLRPRELPSGRRTLALAPLTVAFSRKDSGKEPSELPKHPSSSSLSHKVRSMEPRNGFFPRQSRRRYRGDQTEHLARADRT